MGFCSARQPSVLGRIGDARFANCVNLCRVGNLVYTAGTSGFLNIIDVTVPANPVVIGSLKDLTNLANLEAVRVRGNYAFCACQTSSRVTVVDVSDPTNPFVVTSLQDALHFNGATNIRLSADGLTAYVTTLNRASVCTVDISNPAAPAFLSEQRGPVGGTSMNGARDVILSQDGKYAFVTCDTANCVAIIDCTDRTNLIWVTSVVHAMLGSARGIALSADGTKLFVLGAGSSAQGFNGAIIVIDVTTPTAPQIVGLYSGYGGFGSPTYFAGGRGIVLYQNLAFVVSESGSALQVFDVSNLAQIRFVGATRGPAPGTTLNGAMGIDITNGVASIACFEGSAFVTARVGFPSP